MVWVISMWLISLVLSLTSALIATLLQQWARRYVEAPNCQGEPNHRAGVRWLVFRATKSYKMGLIVQIAPTLLHLSVCLFFAGLVVLSHKINTKVAIAVYVAVGVFALAYIVLSLLPCFDVACPYRTPMSYILWYLWHPIFFFGALLFRLLWELLHQCLDKSFGGWAESCGKAALTQWQYVKNGFKKSIIERAKTQKDADSKPVTELFNELALGDRSKLRKLVASMSSKKGVDFIAGIGDNLPILFRSCAGTHVADEDVRKRSLSVCLDAIHKIVVAKATNVGDITQYPNFAFILDNFGEINRMKPLWNDSNSNIRFTSRSICALLAKIVIKENHPDPGQVWLHGITGQGQRSIESGTPETLHFMNVGSFVYGVISNPVGGPPPNESFKKTLAILLDVTDFDDNFDLIPSQDKLTEAVQWMYDDNPQRSREIFDKLNPIFRFLPHPPAPAPPFTGVPGVP